MLGHHTYAGQARGRPHYIETVHGIGDEMVFTRKFMPGTGSQRCFECQRFGKHRARECPNQEATCEKCGLDGHKADECDSNTTKCVNCGGSHMASDRRCPVFVRARQESGQLLNA